MQHAIRFLEAVLPANGLRVVASKPPKWRNGFKHTFLDTNEELVAEAMRLDQSGVANWFALATYADPQAGRTAINTVQLQCLWLDLDYKHYASTEEATNDIARLAQVVGQPSIKVHSGGGAHVYWVLRQALATSEWSPLARAFQAVWQGLGIQADPISADAARVLRVPGTHNRKPEYGEPREVVIEFFEDITYDATALAKKLGAVPRVKATKPVLPASVDVPAAMRDVNDDLGAGIERRPSFIGPLVSKCRHMRHAYEHQATLSEPQWYAVIGLARHLEEGRKVAHIFSNKHPGYSAEETDAKLAQLEANDIGPTTCAKFKQVNPAACAGCPYNITSPIQLGYQEAESVQPEVTVVEHTVTDSGEAVIVERSARPDARIPQGYKFDGQIMYKSLLDDQTGMWHDEPIFQGFLCPERIVTNERANYATEIQLYVQSAGQPPKRITVPAKALSDKRDSARELLSRGVVFMSKHSGHLLDLLQRMTQDIQSRRRDSSVAEQMGWQDDGMFVVGATGYRRHLPPLFDLPVPTGTKSVVRNYEPAGSLESWKRTAAIYDHPGAEPYQFALCYGAAGVFLEKAKLSGVILSLFSQAAGRGKSTAGYAALSWWGNPNGMKSQSKDTNNALFNKASRHKNLPLLMDEITDKPSWELEDLVYFMSQGREKESLTSERVARPILPGWALPVISTSNNSIKSKLQSRRGDAQGLFARIIEVPMDLDFATSMGYSDRMALRDGFQDNYGHAGPKLVEWAMDNQDMCDTLMDKFAMQLDTAVKGDAAYRFWVASCAATLTVAAVSNRMGLLPYDLTGLSKWTGALLRAQRADAATSIATSDDVLANFLEVNANRIVVSYLATLGGTATAPRIWPEEFRGSQLVGRAELPERSLYISMPAFMRFCHESGFDISAFIRNAARNVDPLSGETLLKKPGPTMVNLGRGTKTASARTKALEFNLLHPTLREYAMGIDTKITEATQLRSVK